MIKKLTYIGIGIVVATILAFFILGYLGSKGLTGNAVAGNLTAPAGSFAYLPIYRNTSNEIVVYSVLSSRANIYLLNSSLLGAFKSYESTSRPGALQYLRSMGLALNDSFVNSSGSLAYVYPAANGTAPPLYLMLDNTPGGASANVPVNASVLLITIDPKSVSSYSLLIFIDTILFVAGIGIALYGVLKKQGPAPDAPAQSEDEKRYVDALYSKVGKGKGKRS